MGRTGIATALHRKRRSVVLAIVGVAAFGVARGEAGFIAVRPVHGQNQLDISQLLQETDRNGLRAPIFNDPAAMIGGAFRNPIEASRQLLLARNANNSGGEEKPAAFKLTDPWASGDAWTPSWANAAAGKQDQQSDDDGQTAPKAANSDSDGGRAGAAIPLPNAAWSGLSCLAAVTLVGGLKRLRRRL